MGITERQKVAARRRRTLIRLVGLDKQAATRTAPETPLHPWAAGPCDRHAPGTVCATCFDESRFDANPGLEEVPAAWTPDAAWTLAAHLSWATDRILKVSGVGEGLAGYPSRVQA